MKNNESYEKTLHCLLLYNLFYKKLFCKKASLNIGKSVGANNDQHRNTLLRDDLTMSEQIQIINFVPGRSALQPRSAGARLAFIEMFHSQHYSQDQTCQLSIPLS